MKNSNTLVCTLGSAAAVVTETLIAVEHKLKVKIDNVVIIHTNNEKVLEGLMGLKKELQKSGIRVITYSIGDKDIISKEANENTFNIILSTLFKYRRESKKLYTGLAGGRKTMSAYLLLASCIVGCDGNFHVLIKGDERKIENRYKHKLMKIPLKSITLVTLPQINLSKTFLYALEDLNKSEDEFLKSISSKKNKMQAFESLNNVLNDNISIRTLRKKYEAERNEYEKLCEVVSNILQEYAEEIRIVNPDWEERVKTFDSVVEKMYRKSMEKKCFIENSLIFNDISGVRFICYFKEDYFKVCKKIEKKKDFYIVNKQTKRDEFGYRATHYDVKLKANRINLLEYRDLKDKICEIQVKTVFAHAWSKLHHRLIYKSDEYKKMREQQKDIINKTFNSSARFLDGAEKEFSRIRKFYFK